ncbi:MAG: OadG-related small transporter subunit [Clostridia bacterium]|nr:OadG-related small transporter subunit [Clostridia bacterium]
MFNINWSMVVENLQKGAIVMAFGITGVFAVLVVFYFLIKVLLKAFPEAKGEL